MRTEINVFTEGRKAIRGLLLCRFHTMEKPKYQLEQETVPTPFCLTHRKTRQYVP